ncbi:MAG: mismatch repair endonuclease MutL [Pseudomonadota bacterium]|jgi:DNA mismatch repair protein MutL
MSIELLPSDVVDQIAAGEVVERPAHMVKEILENSLDAGATEVAVEFAQGGRFVKVTDNGSGIAIEDLPKAFMRFATSKIRESEDLWRLASFGFRGEALASIASVSKVTLFSSNNNSGQGYRLTNHFGKLSVVEPVSRSRGCTVLIEELFQNVPARLKFMKGDAAESGQIKQVIKALAMANPSVEFRVTQDGKLLYYWPATNDHKSRIESVLEIKPLYEGIAVRGRVTARAFFSDPHQVSRVSKSLWFFAQNRYVQDRSLQAAVMEAYRHLLMHGEYPYAVCFLETDPSEIDVNIHPTKSQVKFVNAQEAFRAVQASIRDVLATAPWLQQNPETSIGVAYKEVASKIEGRAEIVAKNLEFSDTAFQTTQYRQKRETISSTSEASSVLTLSDLEALGSSRDFSFVAKEQKSKIAETTIVVNTGSEVSRVTPLVRHWSLLQVVGQVGLTYVVCQSEKGLVLIDQHAAHERVAFERLMNAWRGGKIEVQNFLFPLSVDLSEEKMEVLRTRMSEFSKLGIDLEELGPSTMGIKSAPALLKDRVLVEEMERIATAMLEWGDSDLMENAIGDVCARMACHSVLRAGQSLSMPEMVRLLEEMDEHPLSSFCPHGRPVSVTYSWPELEKDFGRRV